MMLFELKNGKVKVSPESLSIPEIKVLYDKDKTKDKERFHKLIDYVYHCYDKNSPFHDVFLEERKILVGHDRFQDKKYPQKLEKLEEVQALIKKLNILQYSYAEQLLEGANRKIEQYLQFWKDTKLDEDNHKLVVETMDGAEKLLKLQERFKQQIYREAQEKAVGGGVKTMFEDSENQ